MMIATIAVVTFIAYIVAGVLALSFGLGWLMFVVIGYVLTMAIVFFIAVGIYVRETVG